jgi:hypothetical protein
LGIDLLDDRAHALHFTKQVLIRLVASAHEPTHLLEHGTKPPGELRESPQGLVQDRGKREKAEGVTRGGRVKDNALVVHGLDEFHDFGKGHGLVDTRDGEGHFLKMGLQAALVRGC